MLLFVRVVLILVLVSPILLAIRYPQPTKRILRDYFLSPSGALNLGIARVLVFWMIASTMGRVPVTRLTGLPAGLRQVPPGWEWLDTLLPLFDSQFALACQQVGTAAALSACAGFMARLTAPVAVLMSIYILGLPQFFIKINHAEQPLVWCAMILAASPSSAALSLDALIDTWRQGRPRLSRNLPPSVAFNLPLRLCWLSFGVAYFFPGFFKAFLAGDLWITGRAIQAHIEKSLLIRANFSPLYPLHESSLLSAFLGIGTLVFELGFIFALFIPVLRPLAAISGVLFHLGVKAFMGISFFAMLKLYPLFVNFEKLALKLFATSPTVLEHLGLGEPRDAGQGSPASKARWIAVVGAIVLGSNLVLGGARISSWPFSVFPLFSGRTMAQRSSVHKSELVLVYEDGSKKTIKPQKLRKYIENARWNRLMSQLEKSEPSRQQAIADSLVELASERYEMQGVESLVLYSGKYRPRPGKKAKLIARKELVRVPVDPPSADE